MWSFTLLEFCMHDEHMPSGGSTPAVCMQMRDGEAPSYYNPVEASTLVRLLQGLLSYHTGGGRGVTVQDIGVIATFRNQVCLSTTACYTAVLWCVTCCTCLLLDTFMLTVAF